MIFVSSIITLPAIWSGPSSFSWYVPCWLANQQWVRDMTVMLLSLHWGGAGNPSTYRKWSYEHFPGSKPHLIKWDFPWSCAQSEYVALPWSRLLIPINRNAVGIVKSAGSCFFVCTDIIHVYTMYTGLFLYTQKNITFLKLCQVISTKHMYILTSISGCFSHFATSVKCHILLQNWET